MTAWQIVLLVYVIGLAIGLIVVVIDARKGETQALGIMPDLAMVPIILLWPIVLAVLAINWMISHR